MPELLQDMQAGDLVFALSQNAVRYANPLLKRNNLLWPSQLSYYAIGRNTALALHTASRLHVTFPPTGETSEMLLSLPDLQNLSGKKALLLRGNGGRELLGESLAERGATVTFCECYQRSPIFYDGSEQSAHWQRSGVDTLVVTSGEMLQQIYTLVPDYYRSSWLLRCRLVVVSERLAALAAQMGWSDIRVAESADNDALIRALQEFQ
ncbi:Uroporphyrinogen-III synthase [Yersinia rohdei ATCC 43380]|nr:Uroporphyrinogen-III synthase [Yersinia rohdei ATCC 43380]